MEKIDEEGIEKYAVNATEVFLCDLDIFPSIKFYLQIYNFLNWFIIRIYEVCIEKRIFDSRYSKTINLFEKQTKFLFFIFN